MAGLSAGALDNEVELQQLSSEAASGYPVETWTTLDALVWMSKRDARSGARLGAEMYRAAQLSSSFTTYWELQFRDDMDPDVVDVPKSRRLVYRGRVHDIVAAVEIGRREGIALLTLAASGVSE